VRLDGVGKRATSGSFDIEASGPRWAMTFTVRFGGADNLVGSLDVRPHETGTP
jgi:hypothetical protein